MHRGEEGHKQQFQEENETTTEMDSIKPL
jgi:hypothetical protein